MLSLWTTSLTMTFAVLFAPASSAFVTTTTTFSKNYYHSRHCHFGNPSSFSSLSSKLQVSQVRDADFYEMMVGGERYEMIPLPDSMVDTTIFVGNLCEFVTDDNLSDLFQAVTPLNSVPSSVARKANMNSLQYGFVTFMTVEEKEAAIIRFHGHELNGRRIKVEPIKDDPDCKRVRVPERLILYACGEVKKTRDGRTNSLRRVARNEDTSPKKKKKQKNKRKKSAQGKVPKYHLVDRRDQNEMERAARKGYVTLSSTGYRRGRSRCPLANAHRQWCDDKEKPQIIHCKATGGRPLDNIIVDLSPLRIQSLMMMDDHHQDDDPQHQQVNELLFKWKDEILNAAKRAGMVLRDDYIEDNCVSLQTTHGHEEECNVLSEHEEQRTEDDYVITYSQHAWETESIQNLPTVSMGVFEGDRAGAKSMARELADLWDVPQPMEKEYLDNASPDSGNDRGKASRKKGKHNSRDNKHRQRRQRDQQDFLWC